MRASQNEGLKRELGIWDVATNVINISIASGIFLLPALIAGILGNASIVAYGICGIMVLLIALCYAEVSSRITSTGGAYAYIEEAFGPYFGFLANGVLWFGTGVLVSAALINGMADMLSVPFPIFNIPVYRGILFFLLFSFYACINIIGIKQGMNVIKAITLIKISPLVLLVIVGLFKLNTSNLHWEGFPTFDKLGAASIILFFAFIGGETALNISGEMKNPSRTAPLGLILGVVCIVVFFSLIQVVAQSTLGKELIPQKAPLAAVAGTLLGNWGTQMLIFCGVMAIFSSLNSIALVSSRVMFAGAKDGLLPKFLSKVHPKFATPHLTLLTFSLISFLMAFSGGFKQLLILATISTLLLYVGVALAAIKFRLGDQTKFPASFKLPGGFSIPILTLVVLAWFIFQSKQEEIIAVGIFLFVLSAIYVLKGFLGRAK
jgi:basic amino acid/polyamine antiporter, APA family